MPSPSSPARPSKTPTPAIRIRAARYTMDYAVKFCDLDALADVIRDLRTVRPDDK